MKGFDIFRQIPRCGDKQRGFCYNITNNPLTKNSFPLTIKNNYMGFHLMVVIFMTILTGILSRLIGDKVIKWLFLMILAWAIVIIVYAF